MPHLPTANAAELGLDIDRLQVAYRLLENWTRGPQSEIPGAALLVGRHGRMVAPRFFGKQGPEPDAPPLRRDGMFLLASITKPVTYLGAMLLVERGLLNLSDPVSRYIPDFAAHHKEQTLVQHLFTHTSGMPDMLPDNVDLRRQHAALSRFISGAIRDTVPLFPAGTGYSYQSMGTLIVAELVQRISGRSIHQFLREEIFQPLEMESSGLGSRGFPRERLVRVEIPDYQEETDFGWNSSYWQELGAPWGGMFSSPEDFALVCQLMLSGGVLGSVRLLSPGSVQMMTSNRLDDYPGLSESIRRCQPWGLGWRMNHPGTPGSWGDLLDRSVFGHTGATGTMCWVDPRRDGFCLIFTSAIRSRAPWRLVQVANTVAASFV